MAPVVSNHGVEKALKKTLPERLTSEDYGIAVAKGNKELAEKINAALKKLKENGEYDKIYAKWFGGAKK